MSQNDSRFVSQFRRLKTAWTLSCTLSSVLFLGSCSAPKMDCTQPAGKQAILDSVNAALSEGDCATALSKIEGVYNSGCTDTDVRMVRASAQACAANINFFKLLGDMAGNTLTSGGIFVTAAKLFPSTTSDSRAEAAWFAMDALMSLVKPGQVIPPGAVVNGSTNNPGSLRAVDRTDEANMYLIFTALAAMGSSQNRYSAPNPVTYHKTQVLGYTSGLPTGWATAANMTLEGCGYAASVLTFFDAIAQSSSLFSDSLETVFETLSAAYSTKLDEACDAGCVACGFAAGSCNPCPTAIRSRSGCALSDSDKNTCAAAGIANFINTDALLGWP